MGLVLISSVKYVTVQWTWAGYYFAGYPAKLNPDIRYFCSFFKIVFLTKQMLHYFSFSGSFQLDPTEPAALHYTYSNFINIRYLAVNPVRHIRYTYSKLACIFWPHPVGGGLCLVLWGHGHYHRPTCSTRPSQGSLREDQSSMVNTELSIPDPVTTFWSSRSSSYPPMLFSCLSPLREHFALIP